VKAHGESFHPEFMKKITAAQFDLLVAASHERSKTLDELFRGNRWLALGDEELTWEKSKQVEKALLSGTPSGLDRLKELRGVLEAVATWTPAGIEESIRQWATQLARPFLTRLQFLDSPAACAESIAVCKISPRQKLDQEMRILFGSRTVGAVG